MVGFSFPGSPGVIIGHNADIAWGTTNLNPDEMDLYIEKLNPDNPNQYEYQGQWVEMDIRAETIVVSGGHSEVVVVRSTIHGPIITDTYGALEEFDEAGIELPESYAVAMSWTALDESTITEAIIGINLASNWRSSGRPHPNGTSPGRTSSTPTLPATSDISRPEGFPIRSQGDGRWPVPGWRR